MGKTVAAIVGIVAAVAIAVAAPYLAPLALGVLGIAATATAVAIATAVITIGLSLALSFAFRALGVGAPSAKNAVGPPVVFRQSIANSFIVYGKRRVGGLLAFFHARQDTSGVHFRYFVIAVAGHRCTGIFQWMLNDEVVTVSAADQVITGKYANAAWLWFQNGLSSETANATFVSECGGQWTTSHKGSDVCAIYAKFQLTDDVVAAGMPNITAVIAGKYDVLNATPGGESNAVRVFYDWMATSREEGGFGAYSDELPDTTYQGIVTSICDESVDGGRRYELNAVIQTGAAPSEIRDAMIVNMAGTYAYTGGKHIVRPGYWVAPDASLSENDLAGAVQVSPFLPADAAANEVQGAYVSPADNYQGMPFATQKLSSPPTDIKQLDLDLAFTTSLSQANRVARIMLNRAQCEKTVVWPMNIVGLGIKAMDTVQVTKTEYSLDNYAWVVSNWQFAADFGAVLSLREENAEVYDAPVTTAPSTPPTVTGGGSVLTLEEIVTILRGTYPKTMTMDAIDAGSSATIRLYGPSGTSSNFVIDYPGTLSDATVTPKNITGKAYSTLFYPYVDVNPVTLQPATFSATTVYGDAINSSTHPYRIFLGRSVTTPASGGSTTTGGGTGGGYSGGGFDVGGGGGSYYP